MNEKIPKNLEGQKPARPIAKLIHGPDGQPGLNWEKLALTKWYDISGGSAPDGPYKTIDVPTDNTTYMIPSFLETNENKWCRVRGGSNAGDGEWSEPVEIKRLDKPTPPPPQPNPPLPPNPPVVPPAVEPEPPATTTSGGIKKWLLLLGLIIMIAACSVVIYKNIDYFKFPDKPVVVNSIQPLPWRSRPQWTQVPPIPAPPEPHSVVINNTGNVYVDSGRPKIEARFYGPANEAVQSIKLPAIPSPQAERDISANGGTGSDTDTIAPGAYVYYLVKHGYDISPEIQEGTQVSYDDMPQTQYDVPRESIPGVYVIKIKNITDHPINYTFYSTRRGHN